jgi:hypothetical protein
MILIHLFLSSAHRTSLLDELDGILILGRSEGLTKHEIQDLAHLSDAELEECMTELKKMNEKIISDINTHVENGSIAIAKVKEFIKTYDDQRHKHLMEIQRKKKFNSKH